MRILYLHQYFNTPSMSGGTRSFELAKRLVAAGHEVCMITSDRQNQGKAYRTVEAGINVTWIPVAYSNSMSPLRRMYAFAEFAARSSMEAVRTQADVIFATSTPLTIATPGIYAKWRLKAPMVFEVRDLWPEMPIAMGSLRDPLSKFLAKALERAAYHNSAQVVALSPGMRDGVMRAGYSEANITIIPNLADIDRFEVDSREVQDFRARFDWLADRKLVLYAGSIGRVNGVSYLVDIADAVLKINPDVRFLVVGSGAEEALVRRRAAAKGVLERNFFMLPPMPKSEIPVLLGAATVATSLFVDVREMWANAANKFVDALASGTPTAINYGGWQADLINSERCGITLAPNSVHDSAIRIMNLLDDDARLQQFGLNARAVAREQFSADIQAERLLTVLSRASSS